MTEPLNTVSIAAPLPMDATGLPTPLAALAAQLGPVSLFDDVLTDRQVRACMDLGGQLTSTSRCVRPCRRGVALRCCLLSAVAMAYQHNKSIRTGCIGNEDTMTITHTMTTMHTMASWRVVLAQGW